MTSTSKLQPLKKEFDDRNGEEAVATLKQQLNSNHQFDKDAAR